MTTPIALSTFAQAAALATALQETLASIPADAASTDPNLTNTFQRLQGDLSTLVGAANAAGIIHPIFKSPAPVVRSPLAQVLESLIRMIHHQTGNFNNIASLSLELAEHDLTALVTALQAAQNGAPWDPNPALELTTKLLNRLERAKKAIKGATLFLHQGLATLLAPAGSPLTDELIGGRVAALAHWEPKKPEPPDL